MLTMTKQALSVVRTISTHPRLKDSPGVRIAEQEAKPALQVRVAGAPEPGDVTVEQGGGRVYLDPVAADRVRDKVLDVRTDEAGRLEFLLNAA